LQYLQDLVGSWSRRSHCWAREVEELAGYLQFASQIIPHSHAFIHSLYDFCSTFPSPFSLYKIPWTVRRDIEWWCKFVGEWNGVHFILPECNIIHVYTDASGTKGLRGIIGSEWFSVCTPQRYRTRHIQVKEMYAVIYAILCWGESFHGKHVIFHIDNDAVYRTLNDITSCSQDTMSLLHNFLNLACRLNFTFSSLWLSSSANLLADAASRFLYN